MRLSTIFYLVFFNYFCFFTQGQHIQSSNQRIESFNSLEGFYQNTVNLITSDSNGYLWIATPNGLVKYDGYSFDYFYHDNDDEESLPNNYINHLLSDSFGKLWIITKEELSVYLTDKEKFVPIKKEFFFKDAFLKEDLKKRIWVVNGSRISIYNTDASAREDIHKISEINITKELDGNRIIDVEFISDSEFLVSTAFNMFRARLNEDFSVKLSRLQFDLHGGKLTEIIKSENSIWLGTSSGLFQTFYENNRLLVIGKYLNANKNELNKKCEIKSLYFDLDKNLWIGTRNNGIYKYDTHTTNLDSYRTDSKYKNRLKSNRINCFYEDAYGVIWIGTAQGGLNKFDKYQKPFKNYTYNPYDDKSLSSNLITDFVESDSGEIWISFFESTMCTIEKDLNLNSGNQVQFNRLKNKLRNLKKQWVLRIFQDFKGFWWVSTNKGLFLFDNDKNKLTRIHLALEGELIESVFIKSIGQIDDNRIMIGGDRACLLTDPWSKILNNQAVQVDKQLYDLVQSRQINDYVKDNFGNYWFVATNGVFRVANENNRWEIKNHLTTFVINKSLRISHNNVFSIHISYDNVVWLGTFGGGLMKVSVDSSGDIENIKSYHKEDGLKDEVIYGIIEDDEKQLWLSTDMGIGRFNIRKETFNFYDVNNGVLSNNFRQSAYLKTKEGIVLMGGVDGLTIFDPKQIKRNTITPNISISRLKIDNKSIVAGVINNGEVVLEKAIANTDRISIDHDNRNISLDIIVQHTATPSKNKLYYKLEGVNKDWIETEGGKATATYTNLSPGSYSFLYKGTNGDGVWTQSTQCLEIRVLAPWYLRWWCIVIWTLLLLLLIYIIFIYLVRLDKLSQKLKFEKLDKERDKEVNQAKLRFFTNISHDFKTPLSLIIGPLEKIVIQNPEIENQKYFSIIKNNITRLQTLIDQLISYRKAETGNLELNFSKTTLGEFIYPLIESFEEYGQKAIFSFDHKVEDPNKVIFLDINKTERIILNLFSNAIKYSDTNREISLEAGFLTVTGKQEENLFIKVSNTGLGIDPDKMEKIFDRFYRGVEDKNDWNGTGIGLSLCKSLVELMEGAISVENGEDGKTIFRITLPINEKVDFSEDLDQRKYQNIAPDWLPAELDDAEVKSFDGERPTLLIVDDEQDIRTFLNEAFSTDYNVVLAIDGEDGLRKLNEYNPHLVISDVMMPKMNGYDLCKKIKSDLIHCHTPVVLLTAIDDDVKKLAGLELGADDFIVKPFSIKYLEVRVKKLLENKQRVLEYYSQNSFLPKDSLISSSKDQEFLERINLSIEKNMSDSSFGVEELASELCMSTSHFYRKLKELTGQAPNAYLRNFRLQKAAELLRENSRLTAAEVMFEIGIESKSYFSTAFKKNHGMSPSEFVKNL